MTGLTATDEHKPFDTKWPRKILIGYSMRSGSTLLQHMLGHHSQLRSYSDLTSYWALLKLTLGWQPDYSFCLKPMDLFFLSRRTSLPMYRHFNKFLWLARDPRDSYLSCLEAGYAYLFWLPGRRVNGIDVRLLNRWKRVYSHYLNDSQRWYLIRYEELVSEPRRAMEGVFQYLELPYEDVTWFGRHRWFRGGDYKIRRTSTVHAKSVARHERELSLEQIALFRARLGAEMKALGYL